MIQSWLQTLRSEPECGDSQLLALYPRQRDNEALAKRTQESAFLLEQLMREVELQADTVHWTEAMVKKGFVTPSQFVDERRKLTEAQARLAAAQKPRREPKK